MIEWLEGIDRAIVLAVNGLHSPFLDSLMWSISSRAVWIPFYVFLTWLLYIEFGWKNMLIFLGVTGVTLGLIDFTSVAFFKENIARYRPSHNLLLTDKLHFYEITKGNFYKGGQYGFVSSHASNFFGLAVIVGLTLKNQFTNLLGWMLVIAIIVCFSRLYLGVHYLTDLVAGGTWGAFIAFLMHRFVVVPIKKKRDLQ